MGLSEIGVGTLLDFPIAGEVELLEMIRSGGSSYVYKGADTDNNIFAVKVVRANAVADGITQRVFNEINNPLPLSKHIIKAKEHILLESYGLTEPCILFDYVPSKEVSDFLTTSEPSQEGLRRRLIAAEQMALALHHVHVNGYVHGDISPKNFLLDPSKDRVHLIDFETLCPINGEKMNRLWTNKDYMAPEVDQHGPKATSPASDVWSFGLVLIEWLSPQVWERDDLDEGWAAKFNRRKKSKKDRPTDSIVGKTSPKGLEEIWPWIHSALEISIQSRLDVKDLVIRLRSVNHG
ncbi:MAG TPA: protein kinase family protein [Candidatus Poseidoniales archaeon]|nr:MAG TPA: protein kinase family protein [Candidatus Poseidoniales archaeon]